MSSFLIGLLIIPASIVAVSIFWWAIDDGLFYECCCGYSTGPMSQARLITGIRWWRHRIFHWIRRARHPLTRETS